MKKITLFTTALMLTMTTAFAQNIWYIGYPNPEDVRATSEYDVLRISGTGAMQDFYYERRPGWEDEGHDGGESHFFTSVVIEEGVTTIGSSIFQNYYYLSSLTIPASVTTIGHSAFSYCANLKTLVIPEGVTTIGDFAFSDCGGLNSLTIPASVTTIGDAAFQQCRSITSINNYAIAPQSIDKDVFGTLLSKVTLNVPVSSLALYQEAEIWKDFNVVGLYYKVKATSGNEAYGSVSDSAWYELGDNASLTAVPAKDCEFIGWTKDGIDVSTENPYTFLVKEDVSLTANFRSTTVDLPNVPADHAAVAGYYSTAGVRLSQEPQSGVYIVVYEDGKTEKVVRKK